LAISSAFNRDIAHPFARASFPVGQRACTRQRPLNTGTPTQPGWPQVPGARFTQRALQV
jgi:hypothetical protein